MKEWDDRDRISPDDLLSSSFHSITMVRPQEAISSEERGGHFGLESDCTRSLVEQIALFLPNTWTLVID
jgi:hypothetical protein